MPRTDIQTAINEIRKYQAERRTLSAYYDGIHSLTYATKKFKNEFGKTLQSFRDNLCPIIVDSFADRMEVINFAGDDAAANIGVDAWKLWQNSQMELVSNLTHTEALKTGSAFVIVWPDTTGKAKFYLQNSLNCAVIEDAETEEPLFGAKMWVRNEGKYQLNLYYPNVIEKYETSKKIDKTQTLELKDIAFVEMPNDGEPNANPYGVVPMFKFETNPILSDAIPIQDALNKTLCDKLVAMEFAAYPQRYATGLEVPVNDATGKSELPFQAGVDRLWFTDSEKAKFGQFDAANLEQFLKVADSYRLEMARVTGTPLHFFAIEVGDAISGEALKTLEARFTKRINRTNLSFGPTWARAIQLGLKIEGKSIPDNLTTQWQSPEQRSELDFVTTLGLKRANLDIPVETLQEEYGYSAEDIAKFKASNEAANQAMPAIQEPTNAAAAAAN
jgi:Phage portal protein, SPP1 Gp6-like